MLHSPRSEGRPLRLLTFSTLFPHAGDPTHGVFVENRLRHLLASGQATARVVAPVPWVPPMMPPWVPLPPEYTKARLAPAAERRHGIEVVHPRYLVVPKLGMRLTPHTLYRAAHRTVRRLMAGGWEFDLIDAHYFYPDGVAAAWLADELGKPLTITARGTDINLIPAYPGPRRLIVEAAARADGIITVCRALKDRLVELGAAPDKIRVLRNGVDLAMFRPADRAAARAALGLRRTALVSVGHLIERKGHDLVIAALPELPDTDLLIAGDGPEERSLRAQAERLQVADRVRFLGRLAHRQLREVYEAADLLVLASSREGWANVLLEAMACGTPVLASNVWGTPEVIEAPEAGELMDERSAAGVARGVRRLLARLPDRRATRAYAEQFSWDDTTQGQLDLFRSILARQPQVQKAQ
ncbi:glycosyltransferase [Desertibaculum subflavum]|uniref:glycosyltransferase n=1 Tax=Desertibaculum subflavum TaxID=2268458 RepID=UPI000E66EEB3